MLEFIKSPDDVLALKYSGTITGDDLDVALDKLESMLARPGKINCYIEMIGIDGLELSAMPHHIGRSMHLFGELSRFGRAAVVSDKAWIRLLTRLESALLPYIEYRVFEPDESDEALEWAFEREKVMA